MCVCLVCEQVQIFTRDGAFVRKFGATVLQHPRGVTVDFRGRIVVVECKVSLNVRVEITVIKRVSLVLILLYVPVPYSVL